jgi:two-component system, NtrC family, response regulator PilR
MPHCGTSSAAGQEQAALIVNDLREHRVASQLRVFNVVREECAVALPKILVVDDDAESRQLLSEVLEANGYAVGTVADGQQAREVLGQDGEYRIVIADLHMPKETGLELLRHLREQKSNHYIVLMSSFISVSERELAQDLGAQALLEKPFRLSELLDVVGGLAQKRPMIAAP